MTIINLKRLQFYDILLKIFINPIVVSFRTNRKTYSRKAMQTGLLAWEEWRTD